MNLAAKAHKRNALSFRTKLSTAMMLVVSALTVLGLYLAQRNVAATAEGDLQQNFQAELSSLHRVQELRHVALAERCGELVSKPRIHAALEDNALDLLYLTAKDELRDLMEGEEPSSEQSANSLHARFYRFLNDTGAVLPPANPKDVGERSATGAKEITRDAANWLPLGKFRCGGRDCSRGNDRTNLFHRDWRCHFRAGCWVQTLRANRKRHWYWDEKRHLGKRPTALAIAFKVRASCFGK